MLAVKSLFVRTVTGALFVAVIVFCILWSEYSFAVLFALITALSVAEFYRLVAPLHPVRKSTTNIDIIGAVLLFFTMYAYETGDFKQGGIVAAPYLLYFLIRFIMQLYDKKERPLEGWAYSFLGQIYVALPFSLCNILYFRFDTPLILLALFVFIWANDTGAYLVGCTLGRHKLFERISPKKSWEGFWGRSDSLGRYRCVGISILRYTQFMAVDGVCPHMLIVWYMGRFMRIAYQTYHGRKRFGQHSSWAWWLARSFR